MARGKSAKSKSKAKAGRRGKSAGKADSKVQLKAHRKPARGNDLLTSANELWAFCTRLPVILSVGVVLGFCIGLTVAEIDELHRARDSAPASQSAGNEAVEPPKPAAQQPDLIDQTETADAEPTAAPATATAGPAPLYTEETEPNAAPDTPIAVPVPEVTTAALPPLAVGPAPVESAPPEPAARPTESETAEPVPVETAAAPATVQASPEPAPAATVEPGPELASMLPAPEEEPTPPAKPEKVEPSPAPAPDIGIEPSAAAPIEAEPIEAAPLTAPPLPENAPTWLKNSVASIDPGQHPMIAIVLDDVGVAPADAELALKLPGSITLSIMTYAPNVAAFARRARANGHEIMVHMPMEPVDHSVDPGPNALLVGLTEAEIRRRVIWGLSQFDGYVGINNHMGSRFTQYAPGMQIVMEELKSRGLLFLDSRTIAKSVGDSTAAAANVTHISRDVFLDNTMSVDAVLSQLKDAEAVARSQGYVVAIGHPHPTTIAALKRWIPAARKAGFVLVPLSEIVKKREGLAG